jgi:penicillin-binding protein 1A
MEEIPWSPLYDEEGPGDAEFGSWLDQELDRRFGKQERLRERWWQPTYWRGRGKLWWTGRISAGIIGAFLLLFAWLAVTAPLSKSLEPIAPPQVTLLASDGTPIARNGAIVEAPVKVADLPAHVIEPFLAVEDRRFYSHWGVDPRGIARAAWANVSGGVPQGGSTITQQLAKFTFLTPERSLTRKAREALIAFWLEAWLTKDEILERYLSNAYFGDNTYGLRAASLHYFYRQPEKLRPEQAAMLAGLVQAPSALAPTRHYDRAERRMKIVLGAMADAGYLSQAEADAMRPPGLDVRTRNDLPTGTYFADWAIPEARRLSDVGYSRQTITTTLDSRLQLAARQAVANARLGNAQVALVAMRPNGEVVAMIGGKDYAASPFNRATQARRQPGSTFKLFVYLAALDAGYSPKDMIGNGPIEEGSYRPKNSSGNYSDEISLVDAFARSSNVAAVRLYNQVGGDAVITAARRLGVTSNLPRGDPSLALGTSTMTLLELTSAYAGVAANSFPVEPRAFPADEPGWFDWIFDGKSSLSSREHEDMQQMLRQAVNSGTGRAAMLPIANYGKTGTTQDHRDALFVGYAGDLVVGVWIGNDDNSPLAGVSGGSIPARIWRDFMSRALKIGGGSPAPKPTASPDSEGPVEPLDLPEMGDFEIGENGTRLRIEQGEGVSVSTQIDGVPVELRLDQQGVRVNPGRREDEVPAPQPAPAGPAPPP